MLRTHLTLTCSLVVLFGVSCIVYSVTFVELCGAYCSVL